MFCFQVNSVITTVFVGLVVILILTEKSRGSRKGSRRESKRGVQKGGSMFCLHPNYAVDLSRVLTLYVRILQSSHF